MGKLEKERSVVIRVGPRKPDTEDTLNAIIGSIKALNVKPGDLLIARLDGDRVTASDMRRVVLLWEDHIKKKMPDGVVLVVMDTKMDIERMPHDRAVEMLKQIIKGKDDAKDDDGSVEPT